MNTFLGQMKSATNYTHTENGGVTHASTLNDVLDLFAMGGSYRKRSDEDCIRLFANAYAADPKYALKCLFYLRDIRGGQGERRFFRVCFKWLCTKNSAKAIELLQYLPEYGRYDDLIYATEGAVRKEAYNLIKHQLALDCQCKTPSLLAKWLPSENAHAKETIKEAHALRLSLGMHSKEYRKVLSALRTKINVLEKLMSEGRWDEIEFDKIPSKAGIKYRNAFARRDIIAKKYETFAKNENTKVNAKALYPYEIVEKCWREYNSGISNPSRLMLQKYWDNLPDYYGGRAENGLAIVDTSGSMTGRPMDAALSLGAYVAERGHGPFANHFITFSDRPELIEFKGVDVVDKFYAAKHASWSGSTNIEAVFDLLLNTAKKKGTRAEDMPTRLYIFSDMEFNCCMTSGVSCGWRHNYLNNEDSVNTLLEGIKRKWSFEGYKLPQVIFWNLDARQNNIPAIGEGFSYVSGFSPSMIETILSGKDGVALMLDKLNSERYAVIK